MSDLLLFLLVSCVTDRGDPPLPVTTDSGVCGGDTSVTTDSTPTQDSATLTGDDSGATTPPDSGDSTATTPPLEDPDDDYDGDGWTENEGDCNDQAHAVNPHVHEGCLTTGDDDCDGLANENCARFYWERTEASIVFDDFGALYQTQRWLYTNEAGDRLCEQLLNQTNGYGLVPCPQCEWTFEVQSSTTAWSAECAAVFSLSTDGNPGGNPGPQHDWGYSSYYRTEAGEIWGPVLLLYTSHGEWSPIYGVNQSDGYSRGPITVVNFGERSLMYFSEEYSTWNYRPYGYYSSPWP